ncbi:hypothetical protein NQ152_16020 [Microbacterium sp. zg.B48]|uniref:ArsR/SmtB family transcription factor n=1 Tax=Microbacterium sp. zg.B48 TaxID=2969408 RepID=UPI00214CB82E|nr:hypothetical protein [Microbacterium sp. zg.B48]MCR2765013.1 hypothetical protein [Microbacterium sp. zg.B48]
MEAAEALNALFSAVAAPDRRATLEMLLRREVDNRPMPSITEVADELELSRFAASRHLGILQSTALVEPIASGYKTLQRLNRSRLILLEDWLVPFLDFDDTTHPQ